MGVGDGEYDEWLGMIELDRGVGGGDDNGGDWFGGGEDFECEAMRVWDYGRRRLEVEWRKVELDNCR